MILNPFDWRGPAFLAFYAILIGVVAWGAWALRRRRESGGAETAEALARGIARDPYLIACLREGRHEAVHTAVVSLLGRGLLQARGAYLTSEAEDLAHAATPLEKAILAAFTVRTPADQGREAKLVYKDAIIKAEGVRIEDHLERLGLVASDNLRIVRQQRAAGAVLLLWAVAGVKISVALSRGRTNIAFLILLAVAGTFIVAATQQGRLTRLGKEVQRHLEVIFGGLRERHEWLVAGPAGGDLAFLAAMFGLAALPTAMGTMVAPLGLEPPRPPAGWKGGAGGWGGGSCGGGGCGGGGCGGGGCGGGCGGCGG